MKTIKIFQLKISLMRQSFVSMAPIDAIVFKGIPFFRHQTKKFHFCIFSSPEPKAHKVSL